MQNWLRLGDWNATCDSCGFKFKASMMKKRWDGLITCSQCWEQRHPQDLLRIQKEDISPPWVRPVDGNMESVIYVQVPAPILTEDSIFLTDENNILLNTE